jgi:hypothetical protein
MMPKREKYESHSDVFLLEFWDWVSTSRLCLGFRGEDGKRFKKTDGFREH